MTTTAVARHRILAAYAANANLADIPALTGQSLDTVSTVIGGHDVRFDRGRAREAVRQYAAQPVAVEPAVDQAVGRRTAASKASAAYARTRRSVNAATPVRPEAEPPTHYRLTDVEQAVLEGLVARRTLPQIAEARSISVSTVKSHIKFIHVKLGAHTRADAVSTAIQLGIVTEPVEQPDQHPHLSRRERECLTAAAEGHTYAQIGARLALSDASVRTHMSRAATKLGVHGRDLAIAEAIRLGIIDAPAGGVRPPVEYRQGPPPAACPSERRWRRHRRDGETCDACTAFMRAKSATDSARACAKRAERPTPACPSQARWRQHRAAGEDCAVCREFERQRRATGYVATRPSAEQLAAKRADMANRKAAVMTQFKEAS